MVNFKLLRGKSYCRKWGGGVGIEPLISRAKGEGLLVTTEPIFMVPKGPMLQFVLSRHCDSVFYRFNVNSGFLYGLKTRLLMLTCNMWQNYV